MAAGVPPPPLNSPTGSFYWLQWYSTLTNFLNGQNIPWTNINKTGSNLKDLQTRNHFDLQNVLGGWQGSNPVEYHLAGVGIVDAAVGANTKLPTGWNCTHTSTGTYTITTPYTEALPNWGAGATSNTASVLVQWVDTGTAGQIVVHLTNPSGTPTDGAFTFWTCIV